MKVFPEFERDIKIAKVIVNYFHKSAKDSRRLTEMKQPKQNNESVTQWNMLYYLMDSIVELHEAIIVVLATNNKINNLQNHERKTAERYDSSLFEDVTSMIPASRYPTLSMLIIVLNVLKQQMSETEMDDFGRYICGNIDKRWP